MSFKTSYKISSKMLNQSTHTFYIEYHLHLIKLFLKVSVLVDTIPHHQLWPTSLLKIVCIWPTSQIHQKLFMRKIRSKKSNNWSSSLIFFSSFINIYTNSLYLLIWSHITLSFHLPWMQTHFYHQLVGWYGWP